MDLGLTRWDLHCGRHRLTRTGYTQDKRTNKVLSKQHKQRENAFEAELSCAVFCVCLTPARLDEAYSIC